MKISAGSTLRLHVGVQGKPAPAVTWSKERTDIRDDLRHSLDNTIDHSSLIIKDCSRCDTGVYEITAKNACGEKTVQIRVLVLGMYFIMT